MSGELLYWMKGQRPTMPDKHNMSEKEANCRKWTSLQCKSIKAMNLSLRIRKLIVARALLPRVTQGGWAEVVDKAISEFDSAIPLIGRDNCNGIKLYCWFHPLWSRLSPSQEWMTGKSREAFCLTSIQASFRNGKLLLCGIFDNSANSKANLPRVLLRSSTSISLYFFFPGHWHYCIIQLHHDRKPNQLCRTRTRTQKCPKEIASSAFICKNFAAPAQPSENWNFPCDLETTRRSQEVPFKRGQVKKQERQQCHLGHADGVLIRTHFRAMSICRSNGL